MKRKDSQETAAVTKTLLTRVDLDLADAFTAVAARRDRSVAAELRRLIRAEVDAENTTQFSTVEEKAA